VTSGRKFTMEVDNRIADEVNICMSRTFRLFASGRSEYRRIASHIFPQTYRSQQANTTRFLPTEHILPHVSTGPNDFSSTLRSHIGSRVNGLWQCRDGHSKPLLNLLQNLGIGFIRNKRDSKTLSTESTSSTDSVEI
jgi:hypothetical protein